MTPTKSGVVAGSMFLVVLSGCTSHIAVRPDEPLNNDRIFNYAQVCERIAGKRVEIRCTGGMTYSADSVVLGRDSISFVDADGGGRMRVAATAVRSVTGRVHDAPAVIHAAFAGAGLGFVAGMILGTAATARAESEGRMGLAILVLGFTGGGALIGGVIGGGNGREEVFEFTPPN